MLRLAAQPEGCGSVAFLALGLTLPVIMARTFENGHRYRWLCAVAAVFCAAAGLSGCGRDARLADHDLRDPAVGPVTAYGMRLDKNADPKEVVYVLLRAVVDDYAAGDDQQAREKVLDTEFAVCAPEEIKRIAAGNQALTKQEQLEHLYKAINHWAPTLGFYRDDFKPDFDEMAERMYVATRSGTPERAEVFLNVAYPNPSEGEENAGMVARFGLIMEDGFWRIWWVGWDRSTRNWKEKAPAGFAIKTATRTTPTNPSTTSDDATP